MTRQEGEISLFLLAPPFFPDAHLMYFPQSSRTTIRHEHSHYHPHLLYRLHTKCLPAPLVSVAVLFRPLPRSLFQEPLFLRIEGPVYCEPVFERREGSVYHLVCEWHPPICNVRQELPTRSLHGFGGSMVWSAPEHGLNTPSAQDQPDSTRAPGQLCGGGEGIVGAGAAQGSVHSHIPAAGRMVVMTPE